MSKSLRCLIVDDEPLAHKVILEYAKEVAYIQIDHQAYTPTEALNVLREYSIDLMFLDIKMPKLTGLEMLRLIDHKPEVIIASAYEEYALESYDLQVCDYLLKPFRLGRFIQAVEKAQANWNLKRNREGDTHLLIKSEKRLIRIPMENILYLESYGNYVKVWTVDTCHLTARTLSSFEEDLSREHFCKVQKSYIVNKMHVKYLEGNSISVTSNIKIPLSKNYRQQFKEFITPK